MQTIRCKLDHLQPSDYSDIQRIYASHEVRKYLGGAIPEEHHLHKFQETLERACTEESLVWAVRLKDNNTFIGIVSLDNHTDGNFKEISYEFLPESWGNGYAVEVITELLRHALEELRFGKVIAETQSANTASCRLLAKVGMKVEKTLYRYGAEQVIYGIIRLPGFVG